MTLKPTAAEGLAMGVGCVAYPKTTTYPRFRVRGLVGYRASVEDLAALTKARSLLILLLATCKETQLALEAAANALDTDLTADIKAMIERSEGELVELNAKIKALSAS